MSRKMFFRLSRLVLLTSVLVTGMLGVECEKIPIGVVFDQNTEEIQNAFKSAMVTHSNPNRTRLDVQIFVDVINTADAFKLSRLMCNQFGRGVVAMLGAVTADAFDTLHSFANTFQIPFVTPWFPEKVTPPSSGLIDYAVSLRPDYHRAVIDTVAHYGWKNVIYIYDSHDGLLRLQQLYLSLQPGQATFRISSVKRVSRAADAVEHLRALERLDRWTRKCVVLDSGTQLAKEALVLHVRDVHLGRRNYHYFLTGLVMDDRWEKEVVEFGAINITGFRVLDGSRKVVQNFIELWKTDAISAQAALMYDAVHVVVEAVARLLRKKPEVLRGAARRSANASGTRPECGARSAGRGAPPYEHGDKISRMIKKTEIEGLTGPVRFDEAGHRKNFSLQVMEMTTDGEMVKIATWYDYKGLVPVVPKFSSSSELGEYDRNRTYVVATIEEPPYTMRAGELPPPGGSGAFRGFCVDLIKMLSEKLEIKYDIRLVKDGKYGNENPKVVGGWDGLVGELLRKINYGNLRVARQSSTMTELSGGVASRRCPSPQEVDMAVAPLTVTLAREAAVDFSKPFLSFDVKPGRSSVDNTATIFMFLHPLSKEIWLCVACSAVAVSVVLFLVSRFSPREWRLVAHPDPLSSDHGDLSPQTTIVNEFSFWNSLWFSLGSLMQQGSDFTPSSVSGRIVGSTWWFFALVVVSSYTANLASHLTLARISEPRHAFSKVAACPEDTMEGQVNVRVEQDREDDNGWLAYLLDRSAASGAAGAPGGPCEMLVSVASSGVKDFAVALPKGSVLRAGVNYALQSLKDEGELHKLVRKWFTNTECDVTEGVRGSELTLGQVAGLFYVLLGGLALALAVALLEFCQHGRAEAVRANIPLRAALAAGAGLASRADRKPPPRRDHDRLGWNGGAYTGYYTPATQIGQEETALHANFTQV